MGSKPKKKSACLVVEDLGAEGSEKEQELEESEVGDYKVNDRGDREKSGTAKSSDCIYSFVFLLIVSKCQLTRSDK